MFLQRTLTTLPGGIALRHAPAPRVRARRVGTAPPALPRALTLEAIDEALSADAATRGATVLSVSVDDQRGRTRLELARAHNTADAAALAAAATDVFRRAFGTCGALRVDIYGSRAGSTDALPLVATHADVPARETRRAS